MVWGNVKGEEQKEGKKEIVRLEGRAEEKLA